MEPKTVEEQATGTAESTESKLKDSDGMNFGGTDPTANTITAPDADSMSCSDKIITIEDHKMDTAEEPIKTSTTADHENEPARGPNETSNTDDLRNNPVESSGDVKVEIKPSGLLSCPDNVIQNILRFILVSNDQIQPYWNFGALEVPERESHKENFITIPAAFVGNKKLVDEATTILYGENVFKLRRAKVSLWWLKRIGSNVSKIKSLKLSLEEGVMDHFGTRFETLWYSIFLLLQAQHKLQNLKVSFKNWTLRIDNGDGLDPERAAYVWEPRYGIVRTLLSFRGLDKAIVTPGRYLNRYTTDLIQDALLMDPGQTNREVAEFEHDVRDQKHVKYLMDHPNGRCEWSSRKKPGRCSYCGRGSDGGGARCWEERQRAPRTL